jgi:hypothetical protein
MAITQNPLAADTAKPYTVTRAFYWAGEVVVFGTLLQLTKAQAALLLSANKVIPGEPAEPAKAPKAKAAPATPPTEGAAT